MDIDVNKKFASHDFHDFCEVDIVFSILCKKYTIAILKNMIELNLKHFNELLNSIENINNKTLSFRLKEMYENGLIERKIIPGIPVQIEYLITEKCQSLLPIVKDMIKFSIKYKDFARDDEQQIKTTEEKSDYIEPFKLRF